MVSTGVVQIVKMEEEIAFILELGYPKYMLTILGTWKLLGVIAVLIPGSPLVKEWAYAGFFFMMSGAAISHLAMGTRDEIFPSLLLLTLTIISYLFRPQSRRIQEAPSIASV